MEDVPMFDLTPLYRSTVGFDRLGQLLDELNSFEAPTYPPYNIERLEENEYRITMAVAGFAPDELNLEMKDNTLTISGRKSEKANGQSQFLHQGIAARSFERRFQLADYVEVEGADMENGLLHIKLRREIPESMKPRTIPIGKGQGPKTIEGKRAA
jgi:molecular chaperone IbpA